MLADIGTVFRRELVTVRRTPGYAVLAAGLLIVLGGLVAVGGGGGPGSCRQSSIFCSRQSYSSRFSR
ncbi:hypothetical protein BN903_58 [Halorubrum sp. AJ67]|nr:hypothetical protein BN903_58 [Halorubrum sp. AJ67]